MVNLNFYHELSILDKLTTNLINHLPLVQHSIQNLDRRPNSRHP